MKIIKCSKETNQRRLLLRQLSEELVTLIIEARSQNVQVMRHFITKLAIQSILSIQLNLANTGTSRDFISN